jgi:hypothetical protein
MCSNPVTRFLEGLSGIAKPGPSLEETERLWGCAGLMKFYVLNLIFDLSKIPAFNGQVNT